jgi:P4 family phage/plasmid primase-like protien
MNDSTSGLRAPSPSAIATLERIHDEFRKRPQWVGYKLEPRDGKLAKEPYQVKAGCRQRKAQTNVPATWGTFTEALAALLDPDSGFAGIGYVFSKDDPYVGIDFDNCLKDGKLLDWAQPYLAEFVGTYTETSQSGNGLHVIVSGQLSGTGTRRNGFGDGSGAIEMYDQTRFFAMTGRIWDETCILIKEFPLEVAELYAKLKPPKARKKAAASPPTETRPASPPAGTSAADDEVIAKIEQHAKARALWQGDMTGYPSQNEADLALCNHLAYFCGQGQNEQIKRLFLLSSLGVRTKATERLDYLDRTIDVAYQGRTQFYRWPAPKKSTTPPPPSSGGSPPDDGRPGQPDVNYAADDPHRLGRIYLKSQCVHQGKRTLVYHRGEFHRWEESAYRPVADHEVNSKTARVSRQEFDRLNRIAIQKWEEGGKLDGAGKPCDPPTARKVGTRLIGDIKLAIQSETILPDRVESPAWLIDNPPFPAADVLPASTALVHLPSFVEGRAGAIAKPTPAFFCPYALDYGFDPNPPIPQAWIDFLVSVWPNDSESFNALQEWFGYLLTLDKSQHKMALLIGPPRSGRGTICRLITKLLGASNVANPTLSGLATPFGAECLIGKPVAIIGDARQSNRGDWAVALERILGITGNDSMTIARKHRPDWTGSLSTRLILVSNELPKFPDQSGAIATRPLVFRFTESFLGYEDKTLDARLEAELPGILLWAIQGWKRLRERGAFEQPSAGKDLIDQMRDLSSPVGAFVREKCEIGAGFQDSVKDVFTAWKEWCASRNREPGDEANFGKNLRAVCPYLKTTQPRVDGKQVRHFEGLKLKPTVPY